MIKIDVVTGFLGAGKTTFIKKMLDFFMSKGEKCVYVVNEFGKQGIDGKIIENEDFTVYELANGCICCTLKTDFISILKDVIDKIKPDRIIFEPSGIFIFSDFFSFLQNDGIKEHVEIANRICIVDAITFPRFIQRGSYFIKNQTRHSSMIVLSKTQLEEAKTEESVCDIKNINPNIEITDIPFDDMTDEILEKILTPVEFVPVKLDLTRGDKVRSVSVNKKHTQYETMSFQVDLFENYEVLEQFLKDVVSGKYGLVIRGKGFLNTKEKTYLANIVMDNIDITHFKYEEESCFTIIGQNLTKE